MRENRAPRCAGSARLTTALLLMALVAAGCGSGFAGIATGSVAPPSPHIFSARPTARPPARPGATVRPAAAAPEPTAEPPLGSIPTGRREEARVTRVVDGDTIQVAIAGRLFKVRYIGVDTPETVRPGTAAQWMGREASAANARLVQGRTVVLEKDVSQTDRYGRLLRYVWLREGNTWTLVNLILVATGFAHAVTYPPDVKYTRVFLAAQQKARDASLGLWGEGPPR